MINCCSNCNFRFISTLANSYFNVSLFKCLAYDNDDRNSNEFGIFKLNSRAGATSVINHDADATRFKVCANLLCRFKDNIILTGCHNMNLCWSNFYWP